MLLPCNVLNGYTLIIQVDDTIKYCRKTTTLYKILLKCNTGYVRAIRKIVWIIWQTKSVWWTYVTLGFPKLVYKSYVTLGFAKLVYNSYVTLGFNDYTLNIKVKDTMKCCVYCTMLYVLWLECNIGRVCAE